MLMEIWFLMEIYMNVKMSDFIVIFIFASTRPW